MRPKEVKEFLKSIINQPNPPAIFIWGPPGVGKSAVCQQVAEEEKIEFIDLRLALMDPTDLRGIPVPEDGQAKWLPPSALPTGGRGIVFLDELNLAPLLVQSSAFQLILDKKIGEYQLPKGWCVIAAGNKISHGANIYKMSTPLRNRFIHIDFEQNLDDWLEWALKNGIAPEVTGFLCFQPNFLFRLDPQRDENSFPTPRSWEFVSQILKNKNNLNEEIVYQAIAGTVGQGAMIMFREYLRLQEKLPSVDDILNGKKTPPPPSLDISCALINALAARAKPEHFEALLRYSETLLQPEPAVLLIRLLGIKNKEALIKCPSWNSWSKKYYKVII